MLATVATACMHAAEVWVKEPETSAKNPYVSCQVCQIVLKTRGLAVGKGTLHEHLSATLYLGRSVPTARQHTGDNC